MKKEIFVLQRLVLTPRDAGQADFLQSLFCLKNLFSFSIERAMYAQCQAYSTSIFADICTIFTPIIEHRLYNYKLFY